jgi:hypothetical protein
MSACGGGLEARPPASSPTLDLSCACTASWLSGLLGGSAQLLQSSCWLLQENMSSAASQTHRPLVHLYIVRGNLLVAPKQQHGETSDEE